ncbi:MAG: hypothetical protein GC184_13450 [Rhizobiales bacterium]|nr:hypothetical protein [Hyphomicrobiales bacterium]
MARRNKNSGDELVHERPAWIIPALVIAAVLCFSAFFLYYYFGPTPNEILGLDPRASADSRRIETVVAGSRFMIPENYTRYPSQRGGGAHTRIDMHALLPGFAPFSMARQQEFNDNGPKSQVIYFTLRETVTPLPADRRLKDIYSKYLVSPTPDHDPAGLDRFHFRPDSGYRDQDLLVGTDANGHMTLLICELTTPKLDSPNCTRSMLLSPTLELVYRYKRANLPNWREIDSTVTQLIESFEVPGLPNDLAGSITD